MLTSKTKVNRSDLVDGTIELSFNWSINLQNLMILKANLLEEELRARKEILSLLRDTRIVSYRRQQLERDSSRYSQQLNAINSNEDRMLSSNPQQREQKKSLIGVDKFKGQLEVKIHAARKIPKDNSHVRETLSKLLSTDYNRGASSSLYIMLKVQSSSTTQECRTRFVDRVRHTEAEFGEQSFKIGEIPGDAKLIFELYEVCEYFIYVLSFSRFVEFLRNETCDTIQRYVISYKNTYSYIIVLENWSTFCFGYLS